MSNEYSEVVRVGLVRDDVFLGYTMLPITYHNDSLDNTIEKIANQFIDNANVKNHYGTLRVKTNDVILIEKSKNNILKTEKSIKIIKY